MADFVLVCFAEKESKHSTKEKKKKKKKSKEVKRSTLFCFFCLLGPSSEVLGLASLSSYVGGTLSSEWRNSKALIPSLRGRRIESR